MSFSANPPLCCYVHREKKLKSSEEKASEFRVQLEKFLSDPSRQSLDFPASLNSHDRMVIHEVSFT